MDLKTAIETRHSVRKYKKQPIEEEKRALLQKEIDLCNEKSGLSIQLVCDEPHAFDSIFARYGFFQGVENYIALIGKKSPQLEEACGYWGEHLVLFAHQLGLNTCWVGGTYRKGGVAANIETGEKLCLVIALGYGETAGTAHKGKTYSQVTSETEPPEWFKNGVEAALLAPTALHQQKFRFGRIGNIVTAKAGIGPYAKVDLGIVKYHFEAGAGKENFAWGK